jgi:hypothetical protein
MFPSKNSLLSYQEAKNRIASDVKFLPFREMFRHEPLLQFIYHEKCRFAGAISEDRIIYNPNTQEAIGGDKTNIDMPEDEYSPGTFVPLILKGIWLPVGEGTLFTTLEKIHDCPLIKQKDGIETILFLIHPKSEGLYQSLLSQYTDSVIEVSALALSSYRSLLVAVSDTSGGFTPVLAKVTLDQEIQGVHRVLTRRECAVSVANTAILAPKIPLLPKEAPLQIFEDPLSYIPQGYEYGMLYRKMPSFLDPQLPNDLGLYTIPLLSLYSVKNRELLQRLVTAQGGTVTEFLTKSLLKPFACIFIELLYHHQTSIEAHGQNLLLILDKSNRIHGLLYRDMGGVNQLINEEEFSSLPQNIRHPEEFYSKNHKIDAAKALEHHFIRRGLFPLTKQLVKCASFQQQDHDFKRWFDQCAQNGFLKNWTTADLDSELHHTQLTASEFFRYGYVEYLFLIRFVDYLLESGIIDEKSAQEMEDHFFQPEQLSDKSIVAPCSNIPFFSTAILDLLNKKEDKMNQIKTNCFRP